MRFLLSLLLFFSTPALADSVVQLENTKAELISAQDGFARGEEAQLAIVITHKTGWHSYWENPGDAGIPTTFNWTLPEGVTAGKVSWPLPIVMREDILTVYAYKDETVIPVTLTIPENYAGDSVPVKVEASWLVCEKICIPESAELTLELPVVDTPAQSADHSRIEASWAALPQKYETTLGYEVTPETIRIALPAEWQGEAMFFAREQNHLTYSSDQKREGDTLVVLRNNSENAPQTLSGYLTIGGKAYDVTLQQGAAVADNTPSSQPVIVLILFAIVGGLILNLMPCVLPVLSLKAIAIAKKSAHDRKVVVNQALAYTLGVVTSFALIAILLISLQKAGAGIGWGFQMQSASFVGFLTILLFLVGMNLAGLFELPVLFGNTLSDTREHTLRGSFLTGVLATAVATPCTAPFMATAVGAALTQPPVLSFLILISIGVGLALPFLLIAITPRAIAWLPKPGAWMVIFKELMAFPMFASVIWLLWVLTQQVGPQGLLVALITMLAVSFIIWLQRRNRLTNPWCRWAMVAVLVAAILQGVSTLAMLPKVEAVVPQEHAFSEKRLEELRTAGTPVFVDATAAWCLTCQVNARVAINTPATMQAFEETGTELLIADWTNKDAEITAFLKRFGYNGVPLYVYFPPSGEPKVLPQLLTESLVINTVKGTNP